MSQLPSSLSRRKLVLSGSLGVMGTLFGAWPAFASAAPENILDDLIRQDPMAVEAYHGVTGSQHQSNFDRLSRQGYRIISLSVYGAPGDPRYAAVWVQRQGAASVAVHGVNSAGYQSFFNTWTAKGFAPVIVSATGPMANAVFAAVFEQGIAGTWLARHNMTSGADTTSGTFQNQLVTAHDQKMILRSLAIYGTAADRRYAAIWHPNPGYAKWHVHPSDSSANYQGTFNSETQLPGYQLSSYRPAYVALSDDQIYCSAFRDDYIGPWVARHGLTAAAYQTEFNAQKAKGFYPICVQGGGTADQTRYAAIFAQRDIPLARAWSVAGTNIAALTKLDNSMQTFMQAHGVRAAQLTIAKSGVTKLARAYTWAEAGYHPTRPSDRFLLASCSKIFTSAAIQSLYDAKKLTPTTTAYPLLGFSHPADSRSDQITIQQLLDHQGGFDRSKSGDPTYSMRDIAISQKLGRPVNKLDIAQYMYARPLDFQPGTGPAEGVYSNYGYHLLSLIVEHVTGINFFDYVQKTLLQPANITEVLLSSTLANQRPANQAICEDQGLGLSPIDLASSLQVPSVYGGDGMIKEVAAGSAGIACSATALTLFIHQHAVWGNGPRTAGTRIGSTPGAYSLAHSRDDGIDWAFVFNTRDWAQNTHPTVEELTTMIDNQLDTTPIA
ncbi:MAG: serine hydrolase [Ktedonobacteraceae bacterium]|nr:serine hydrolase [Ktedonobacteraceae bacterium]